MKVKVITGFFLLMLVVTGCSSIIYAIRGPKYKGKFDIESYPKELDSTSYYICEIEKKDMVNKNNNGLFYSYVRYTNKGLIYGYSSKGRKLNKPELDTMKPFKNYFIYKNGYLRWEIYHDSYNGYNLYKAKVYTDSIVAWQILDKRASITTYYKMK
ncbi:hypothetical protein [Lutibacter sp.]